MDEMEYMEGLVEVKRLVEAMGPGNTRALDLLKERIRWPKMSGYKPGMYCEDCGLIVYSEATVGRCPRCGSYGWYFIMDNWQPKAQFGSVTKRVCARCKAIVFVNEKLERCPVCGYDGGELGGEEHV